MGSNIRWALSFWLCVEPVLLASTKHDARVIGKANAFKVVDEVVLGQVVPRTPQWSAHCCWTLRQPRRSNTEGSVP